MAIAHRSTEQYAASTTATTHDFTIPASAQVDDILILCAGNRQVGNDPAQPSGWELGSIDATGSAHNLATLWRKCQAGDPGSTVTLTWPSATEAQGGIVAYSGVDTVTPMDVALTKIVANPSANTHTAPTITPANNDTLLVHVWVSGGISPWASADGGTQRYNAIATATPRAVLYVDRPGPAGGVASSDITATLTASAVQQSTMHTLALRAAAEAPTEETLRPTSISGLSNLTGAVTDIDEDPDGTITDAGLVGADPSGVPPNITFEGSVDNTGNPTTSTSVTIPATVNDGDIILVSVVNGDGTAQPTISDNSGVGNWTDNTNGGVAKFQAGTAMAGAVFWKRITNQAVERSKVVSLGGITGSTCANLSIRRGCVASGSPIDGTPVGEANASANNTQAGITTLTDGAAVHVVVFYSDNTAVTTNMVATSPATITKGGEIYSSGGSDSGLAHFREIKATAGATGAFTWAPGTNQVSTSIAFALKPESSAAQTVNTQADVAMADPVASLATGAGTGEIRARIRKKGTGSNPQGRIEVRNAAGTLLGTPVIDRAITESDADGQLATAFFNQSIILNKDDVVLRFVGTGAAGGLAELVAVEWNAQITTTTTQKNTAASASLGGVTAGVPVVLRKRTVASGSLGGITISPPTNLGKATAASAGLGGLTASGATNLRKRTAGSHSLGGITVTPALRKLGRLASSLALGGLAASAGAVKRVRSAASTTLGGLTASPSVALGKRSAAQSTLGGLTAQGQPIKGESKTTAASAALGGLTVSPQTRKLGRMASAIAFGGVTVGAGVRKLGRMASSQNLGGLTASVPVVLRKRTAGSGNLGGLTVTPLLDKALGLVQKATAATVNFGGLTTSGTPNKRWHTASSPTLGGITVSPATVGRKRMAASTALGGLTVGLGLVKRLRTLASAALGGQTLSAADYLRRRLQSSITLGGLTGSAGSVVRRRAASNLTLGGLSVSPQLRKRMYSAAETQLGGFNLFIGNTDPTAKETAANTALGGLTIQIGQLVRRARSAAASTLGGQTGTAVPTSRKRTSASANLGGMIATAPALRRALSGVTFTNGGLTAQGAAVLRKRTVASASLGGLFVLAQPEWQEKIILEILAAFTSHEADLIARMNVEDVLTASARDLRVQTGAELVLACLIGVGS